MNKNIIIVAIVLIISVSIIFFDSPKKEIHEHADFAVYLDNIKYNFSQSKYMEVLSQIHMHDLNGNIIHKHAENITLLMFFSSLGMNFNSTCFILDNGSSYCNNPKFYVNDIENKEFENYNFNDLDRIVISVNSNITLVTNESCIYSNKCPERGSAPKESNCNIEAGCS